MILPIYNAAAFGNMCLPPKTVKNRTPFRALLTATAFALWLPPMTSAATTDLWVSPAGSDANSGSQTAPLASLPAALEKWSRQPRGPDDSPDHSLHVILRDGIYALTRPVIFLPTQFKHPGNAIYIEAAPGEHPILSGGAPIQNWRKVTGKISGLPDNAKNEIWMAPAPKLAGHTVEFRQLWVNDIKAIRARTPTGDDLVRLVAWDKTKQVATIPMAALAGVEQLGRLEMIVDQVWEIAVLRVQSLRLQGTNALVTFKQPEGKIEFEHPWPPVIVNTNYHAPFFLANAIQFLDSPGEWFEDVPAGLIYYWPRDGEDMTTAKVVAPVLETLVQISGLPDAPVSNLHFRGIAFAHTTWLRPSKQGHVPLQAGMFLLATQKLSPKGTPYHRGLDNLAWIGRPPAAVELNNANHASFERCTFEHLASAGLDFTGGTHDDRVTGCIFHDIGGNGLQLGKFSDTNVETHIPWQPTDDREICTHETVANNLITDCGNEDWGCIGICAGYVRNVIIAHNEIFNLPYTGISVGWGWTKTTNAMRENLIEANHVHHVAMRLGDTAGIYTLSAQPGTVIAENSISDIAPSPWVPDPDHWFYLYLDEGSSGITVRDNWCPTEKFLKNANGPGNVWTNNGPQVSGKIKDAAGLEPAFQDLLQSYKLKSP